MIGADTVVEVLPIFEIDVVIGRTAWAAAVADEPISYGASAKIKVTFLFCYDVSQLIIGML